MNHLPSIKFAQLSQALITKKETQPVTLSRLWIKSPTMSFRQTLQQMNHKKIKKLEEKESVIAPLAEETPQYMCRMAGAHP